MQSQPIVILVLLLALLSVLVQQPAQATSRADLSAQPGAFDKDRYTATLSMSGDSTFDMADVLSDKWDGPMPAERNTTDEWSLAMEFHRKMYGLDFTRTNRTNGFLLLATQFNVYTRIDMISAPGFPETAGSTEMYMTDDSISAVAEEDAIVFGEYGGHNGTWVPKGSRLIYGYYRPYWRHNNTQAFPRLTYFAMMPMLFGPDGSFIVDCEVRSRLWGQGVAKGVAMSSFDPATNKLRFSTRTTVSFPGSLAKVEPQGCGMLASPSRFGRGVEKDDIVARWNKVLHAAIRMTKYAPPRAARAQGMLHTATDEALRVCRRRRSCSQTFMDAAVSFAAHQVLGHLFAQQQKCFDGALQAALEPLCGQTDRACQLDLERGRAAGIAAGRYVVRDRLDDGSDDYVPYEITPQAQNPNAWQPTWPTYVRRPDLPQFARVRPFAVHDASAFRQLAPMPDLDSPEFNADFDEVFRVGRNDTKGVRSHEQTITALFWEDGAGTETPPGHWHAIARDIVRRRRITDTLLIARIFRLLGVATADAGIAAWDIKYWKNNARPSTIARLRDPQTDFFPFLPDPVFPDHVSGHSTFSNAGARMLALIFDTDDVEFETTSDRLVGSALNPAILKKYTKLSQAAADAGISRIYGGIHFNFANRGGANVGKAVAEEVFDRLCRNRRCLE